MFSFCSQSVFLSSVPRSLRSKASGLEKARQISWRVFYLRQSFVNLSRKEHGAVTRPHLWNLMDTSGAKRTQNCPVPKCSLVATGSSQTRRCNRDTFHSSSPYWRSMRAIDDKWIKWIAKWFISTSSSWVKILGIPKKPGGGKGTTHPNASSDVQSTNQLPSSDHWPIMMKHYQNTLQTFVDCRKIAQRHTLLLRYIAKHCLDAKCLWTCSTNMCQSLSLCLYDVGVARCLQHLPNESQVTLLFGAVLHDFLLTSPYI